MKKYVLDIKIGTNTEIDIDHAPDVTEEEFMKVIEGVKKFMDSDFIKKFKFRAIDRLYKMDFERFLVSELNNIGKVIRHEWIEEFRICIAFMA